MNKKEKIKKRTWKYFWQQKLEEIGLTLGITGGVIFLPYYLSILFSNIFKLEKNDSKIIIWFGGLVLLLGIAMIFLVFCAWIETNWEKAKERAKEDYKK